MSTFGPVRKKIFKMDDDSSLIEDQMQILREYCSRIIQYDLKQIFRQLKEESINKTTKNLIREIVRIESLCFNEPFFDEEDLVSFNKPKLLNYYKMCQAEMSAMNYNKFEVMNALKKEFKTKNYENLCTIYASKLAKRFTEVPNKPMTLKEETRDHFKFTEFVKRIGFGLRDKEPVVSKKLNISNYYLKYQDELMAMENGRIKRARAGEA
ncbi:hypothetical protein TSAR_001184 [Trichomalopsis sarcophagae]|uniref:Uncharacterized protein n=1 Tax=Trichomalopsis sarcophagae TaxID=543379 RepID=A0A232FMX3_9HYME|nr:hypothetical protein TSAR_001184 [Trichomalopsis sarcophagae]